MQDELTESKNETPKNHYLKSKRKVNIKEKVINFASRILLIICALPLALDLFGLLFLVLLQQAGVSFVITIAYFRMYISENMVIYLTLCLIMIIGFIFFVLFFQKHDNTVKLKYYRKNLIACGIFCALFIVIDITDFYFWLNYLLSYISAFFEVVF